MYNGIKQEAIQVEDVPEDDEEDNPPIMAERDSVPPLARIGRGKRVRVPSYMLIPTIKGKHYDKEPVCRRGIQYKTRGYKLTVL